VDLADDLTLGRLASWRIRMSRSRNILGSDCFFISKGILSSTNLIYTVTTMRSIPLMFCERFWSMSMKTTSPLYAESTKFSALARGMSFIARYMETQMSFRLLLKRPTLPDGLLLPGIRHPAKYVVSSQFEHIYDISILDGCTFKLERLFGWNTLRPPMITPNHFGYF
jgi:hypothetical protein